MNLFVRALCLLVSQACLASTFYVAPGGNDGAAGTADAPWANPGLASKRIAGGDTLVILSGDYVLREYWDDMVTPPSGSPGRPTVVRGEGVTRPRLLGADSLYSCIAIENGSHIEVRNLELTSLIDSPYTGGVREGIDAGPHVRDLCFEDIEIHHVEEMGFNLGGDARNVTIRRCAIHHNGYTALGGPPAEGEGWVNVLVDSCTLSYSGHYFEGQEQPSPFDRPDGLGFEPSEGPVEVRYTKAEHNRGDGLDSKARRTFIHHCVVANNWGDGVKLWGASSRVENTLIYGTGDGDPTPSPWCLLVIETEDAGGTFEVTNVTMWDSPDRSPHYVATVQYDNTAVPIMLALRNVIVSGRRQFYASPIVQVVAEGNLFDIDDEEVMFAHGVTYTSETIGSLGFGNLCMDPQFVGPAWGTEGDFHLVETSPAVDSGLDTGLADDLDGFPRPYNGAYDRGCYEYHPPCVSFPLEPGGSLSLRVVPTPARSRVRLLGLDASARTRTAHLVDMAGRVVASVPLQTGGAPEAVWLDVRGVRPGIYAVTVTEGGPALPLVVVP